MSTYSAAPRSSSQEILGSGAWNVHGLLLTLAFGLAVSGLAELVLQRLIYRVGIHIPRSGLFLELYRIATSGGDFAFKLSAVLVVMASALTVLWLLRQRREPVLGALMLGLIVATFLAWPFGFAAGSQLGAVFFALGLAWVMGQAIGRPPLSFLNFAIFASGAALLLGQYRTGFASLGVTPDGIGTVQLASELALLVAVAFFTLAAARAAPSRWPTVFAVGLTLLLVSAFVREPTTVAIVSLWATSVTMSLPAVLYVAAFGGVAFVILTWLRCAETRQLGVGLCLLVVAGLQPQVLHHELTALLGLTLLLTARPQEEALFDSVTPTRTTEVLP